MPKILIVDDDPLMHVLYKARLEQAGYQSITARNGNEAIEMAARELPQLILLDIMMEGMDGLTALRQLKKTSATQSIPVIITTAIVGAHAATRRESELAGAAGFLPKPFSPAQLLAEIQRLVTPPAAELPSGEAGR